MEVMKKILTCIFSCVVSVAGVTPAVVSTVTAEETPEKEYTSVLYDLKKDESFDISKYPSKEKDYSLQVIQIAESKEKELFIYVYQPSDEVKELTATKILFSTAINESFSPSLYDLTLVNTDGVFDKYKVENYEVKADTVRYYDIVRLQRAFAADIDEPSGTDNVIEEVSSEIGQLWTACTIDGNVTYQYIYNETIEITDKWTGFIRYYDGFKFYYGCCDAWFIAFDTDKRIEKLTEATVAYNSKPYSQSWNVFQGLSERNYGEEQQNEIKLSHIDEASNEADGLFGKTYTWNRIESIDTFLKTAGDLTDEAKSNLDGKKWVLRFLETDYEHSINSTNAYVDYGTEVSKETILQLSFETDGKAYNLGVVDNEQTPDREPDGGTENETPDWLKKLWEWVKAHPMEALIALVLIIVGLPTIVSLVVSFLPQILPVVIKGVVWLVKAIGFVLASPFLLIGWIINEIVKLFK